MTAMLSILVASAGMLAVGMLVWRLLQAQEAREEQRDPDQRGKRADTKKSDQ